MKIPRKLKEGSAKATRTLVAGVLAVGLMPVPAFAATDLSAVGTQDLTTQADPVAKNSTGYITAAAYAAAEPAPEILGLNNFNFRTGTNGAAQNKEVLDIAKMFGNAEINEAVNPFVYNAANGLTPGVQYDGRGGGPTAALAAVNDKDWGESATKVWAEKPNIVLGTGSDQYPKADASDTKGGSYEDQFTYYTTKGSEYTGVTEENYSPVGCKCDRNTERLTATVALAPAKSADKRCR